jgi:hypothetical protein
MARLNEDAGNYRPPPKPKAPAPKAKPKPKPKPVKAKHAGQISGIETGGYNARPKPKPVTYVKPKPKPKPKQPSRGSGSSSKSGSNYKTSSYSNNRGSSSSYGKRPVVSRPSSGATAGGTIAPTVAKPVAPKPVVPKFDKAYLAGDLVYGKQLKDLGDAYTKYELQSGQDITAYDNNYNNTVKRLGQDQTKGASDLAEDYASRGLLESGIYANALNDYNADFTRQTDDLTAAQALYKQDMTNEKNNFKDSQALTQQQAYQDALNRYNLKYK